MQASKCSFTELFHSMLYGRLAEVSTFSSKKRQKPNGQAAFSEYKMLKRPAQEQFHQKTFYPCFFQMIPFTFCKTKRHSENISCKTSFFLKGHLFEFVSLLYRKKIGTSWFSLCLCEIFKVRSVFKPDYVMHQLTDLLTPLSLYRNVSVLSISCWK